MAQQWYVRDKIMAFQIDPNIPLQANKVQFDPASILSKRNKTARH